MHRGFVRHLIVCVAVVGVLGVPAFAADVPGPMLDAYLRIHAALAGDKIAGIPADAATLGQHAKALGTGGDKVAAAARTIGGASDIKAARAAFGDLSDAMIALVNSGSSGKDVRVAYCPMVKKSWLQKGDQIANPYYGSEMLRCGEFKK